MSFVINNTGAARPNFLDSDVGLVLKTNEVPATLGVEDENGRKIVAPGTVFPANDSSATGIVFESVDVTGGNMPGSVLVAGRVLEDALTIESEAKTALTTAGIVFVTAPAITRD